MCRSISASDSIANILLQKSKLLNDVNIEAYATNVLGRNLLCQGKPDEAILLFVKSCSIYKVTKNERDYVAPLNNLATANRLKSDFKKAKIYSAELLLLGQNLKNDTVIAQAYAGYSGIYATQMLADSTAIYGEKALEISKRLQLDDLTWKITVTLGGAFFNDENFEPALSYFLEVIPLLEKKKDIRNLALVYNNIGSSYSALKDSEKSISAHKKSIAYAEQANYLHVELVNYSGLGHVYSDIDDYETSNINYLKTLELLEKLNIPSIKADVFSNLTNNYYKQGDFAKAIAQGEKAIAYTKENAFEKKEMETYNYMYQIHRDLGNSKKALEYLELFNGLKEKLAENEEAQVIKDLDAKYKVNQLKNDRELLEKKLEISNLTSQRNSYLLIFSVIALFLLIAAALLYYSRMKVKKKEELLALELQETQKRLTLEKQYRKSEIKTLRSQMNPHFIFNALNSIQDYIIQNEQKLARTYLVKFSRLIRMYLEHSQQDSVSLMEELTALELYLELEKARFEDSFTYEIESADITNAETIQLPSFLVQPYVENAIKHGLLHRKENKQLHISFELDATGKFLLCTIKDNGIGREASAEINSRKLFKPKSFSSEANDKRIELLNKTRNHPIELQINDILSVDKEVVGTIVCIKIPLTV
ncbi:tetratricopeptide repeat-containing sensor histidine kinase [Kordia antarctica]|nr:histidine kinase [Kordia antarctica]